MTVLLLAGTGEARIIAKRCADMGIKCIATLSGATRHPKKLPVPMVVGGFGGAAGFRAFLTDHEITRVIDATHPFAAHITQRSYDVALGLGLPYLRLERPPWVPEHNEIWTHLPDESAIRPHLTGTETVFLATGRQTLPKFDMPPTCRVLCRQIDEPDTEFPFKNGAFVLGRPPFSVQDEIAIFKKNKVDVLVVKNAGGAASRTKLTAAGALGIRIFVIDRPVMPDMPTVETVKDVMTWLTTSV